MPMSTVSNPVITVRPAGVEDIGAMIELDRQFGEGIFTRPDLVRLLTDEQEIACMVAVEGRGRRSKVVGFLMYEIHGHKFDCMALVVKDFRYGQIADPLMRELARSMRFMNRNAVFHVRESDLTRQLYLRDRKFLCKRIVRRYFRDYVPVANKTVYEDAYRFHLKRKVA
jgi:hypothetical protein